MTGDAFTRDKLQWLEQIAADATLPPTAARLAIVLSAFVNRGTGDAWPSVPTLAGRLGVVENAVRRSLRAMLDGGHLDVETGHGRNNTNRYRWRVKPCTEMKVLGNEKTCTPVKDKGNKTPTRMKVLDDENLHGRSQKPSQAFTKTFTPVHPNLLKNTIEETSEERLSLKTEFERFWLTYPKKAGKAAAKKAFDKAVGPGASSSEIIAGAARYAAERDREPDPEKRTKFTAHAATWLHGRRWEDEPGTQSTPSFGGSNGSRPYSTARRSHLEQQADLGYFSNDE